MRVITGKSKGSKLVAPKGLHTRPTSDKVKESIFNILGYIPNDSMVLDLYAGSGNIGIEFLSRGAETCYFIDNDINSIKSIKDNLRRTKLIEKAFIYRNTAEKALDMLGSRGIVFDYIFLDPPYEKEIIMPILEKISNKKILKNNGSIIAEHESELHLPECFKNFVKKDFRKYGRTTISFYIFGRFDDECSISRNF